MDFIIYDLILLVIFAIFIAAFLYRKRKKVEKEGLLFLYKTSWGIKLINNVGTKHKKTLEFLSYVSIAIGYILMAGVIYLFGKIIWIYVAFPTIVREIKVPPIMPLIPYIDKVVPFLPPFYFTYWIVILAIIAITHEFAHGIFAAHNKVKIKTTGFGFFPYFLPIFLAAFVELDEKRMAKKKKLPQMAILSAGTFANVLTAVFFFVVMWIFFTTMFTASGVIFDTYAYSIVDTSSITMIEGVALINPNAEQIVAIANQTGLSQIEINEKEYVGIHGFSEDGMQIALYDKAPAISSMLIGVITHVNGVAIDSREKLSEELQKYSPGEEVKVTTLIEDEAVNYKITLGTNPYDGQSSWLGIGFMDKSREGIIGSVYDDLSSFKEENVYYAPKVDGFSIFIYNLLWWIILISLSVALVNMLPVGIFDGGRFFYLTILGITGSQKIAKRSFKAVTWLFLLLLLLLMVFWVISFF